MVEQIRARRHLKAADIPALRRMAASGHFTYVQLGAFFNISPSGAWRAARGITSEGGRWKQFDEDTLSRIGIRNTCPSCGRVM
jgi:hypothetical protein